jgi:hypothetical protein
LDTVGIISRKELRIVARWKPDQTFYPSARMATQAPPEKLAYVVTFNPKRDRNLA